MLDLSRVVNFTDHTRACGLAALPYLVRSAQRRDITDYKRISEAIGKHPRLAGLFLGFIRDAICIPNELPLINVIAVRTGTSLPGESFLPGGASHLSKEEYRAEFERLRDEVFLFDGWDKVLEDLGLEPLAFTNDDLEESARQYNRRLGGGGGEGERHLGLKRFVANHPNLIGLKRAEEVAIEHEFPSGDIADILFHLSTKSSVVVEVKKGPHTGELVKGVFQAIKYRALVAAERGGGMNYPVSAFLCAYEIPKVVEEYASRFSIQCVRVSAAEVEKFSAGK